MKFKDNNLGFSFKLPESWKHDLHNLTLTFFGPDGRIGYTTEVIQIRVGTILPLYYDPIKREGFMAEPGAKVFRSKLGNESNVVVLQKPGNSEITAVHDGLHYSIVHSNDTITLEAVEILKGTFRFPSVEEAITAIQRSADPQKQAIMKALRSDSAQQARQILSDVGMPPVTKRTGYSLHNIEPNASDKGRKSTMFVPQLERVIDVPKGALNPYTPAEMNKKLSQLKGKVLMVDYQKDIDGPQTATRLIKETLSKVGVTWVENKNQAEAIIWIQGGNGPISYTFVVAHPDDKSNIIAAECGPRELTATIMTAICEYFHSGSKEVSGDNKSMMIDRVNELNRAITSAALAQDWIKARKYMNELKFAIGRLGSFRTEEVVKPIVNAIADSSGAYESTGFSEAKALREAAIKALKGMG